MDGGSERIEHQNKPPHRTLAEQVNLDSEGKVRIVESPPLNIGPIRTQGFDGLANAEQRLARIVTYCKAYAEGARVEDTFGNDDRSRNQWETVAKAHYGPTLASVIDHNKFRRNGMTPLYGGLDTVRHAIAHIESDEADQLRSLIAQLPSLERYDEKDPDEKLAVVQQNDAIARSICALLAPPLEEEAQLKEAA
jgi:hypothetical protein